MASITPPVPTVLSCDDSELSVLASIFGILTFTFALTASSFAFFTVTQGASNEIARLDSDLRTTLEELKRVKEYFHEAVYNSQGDGTEGAQGGTSSMQELYENVQGLLRDCLSLSHEVADLLYRSMVYKTRCGPLGLLMRLTSLARLRSRIVYVMSRNEVADKMRRLNDQKVRLSELRMSQFLGKSAMHDAILKQISERMEARMEHLMEIRMEERMEDMMTMQKTILKRISENKENTETRQSTREPSSDDSRIRGT